MRPCIFCVSLLCCGSALADDLAIGRWKLTIARSPEADLSVCILNLDRAGDAWSARVVAGNRQMGECIVKSCKVAGGILTMELDVDGEPQTFEGVIDKQVHFVRGSYGNDRRIVQASLAPTTDERITRDSMLIRNDVPEVISAVISLQTENSKLHEQLMRARSGEEFDSIVQEVLRFRNRMNAELPVLCQKVLADYTEHPSACTAGLQLLANSYSLSATEKEIKNWADATLRSADRFGPRYRRDALVKIVDFTGRNARTQSVAAEFAEQADREIAGKANDGIHANVLSHLIAALTKTGQPDKAKPFADRLEGIETKRDEQYRAKLPKLDAKPVAPRKVKDGRVALIELFAGTEAGQCAASELAFDKLLDLYKPADAIFLQYHVHRPGPNPLANADSEARFHYYDRADFVEFDNVPSVVFGGKPRAGGGGAATEAKNKLTLYRDQVDSLRNLATGVKLDLKVTRAGDEIKLTATANELGYDTKSRRLRFALVEERIRFEGGSGVRFHGHVVRCMPGGPVGFPLDDTTSQHTVAINPQELRGRLTKQLDDYALQTLPFPRPGRPMKMEKLKAVAWIQDDSDRNVLQAIQVDVPDATKPP